MENMKNWMHTTGRGLFALMLLGHLWQGLSSWEESSRKAKQRHWDYLDVVTANAAHYAGGTWWVQGTAKDGNLYRLEDLHPEDGRVIQPGDRLCLYERSWFKGTGYYFLPPAPKAATRAVAASTKAEEKDQGICVWGTIVTEGGKKLPAVEPTRYKERDINP